VREGADRTTGVIWTFVQVLRDSDLNEDLNRKTFYESLKQLNNLSRDRRLATAEGRSARHDVGTPIFGGLGMIALALLQGTKHGWVQLLVTVFSRPC
jgi:hypothetical protein